MTLRQLAIGTVALLAAVAALSAISSRRPSGVRPSSVPGSAHLHAFGSRSVQQRQSATDGKLDAALADLSSHAGRANPEHWLADLHSLNPAARFMQPTAGATPLVLIDAVTRGDPQRLKEALVGLGLQGAAVYSNDVGGWLPVTQIEAAATNAEVHSIRAAMPHASAGAVTSQGDFVQRSDVVRTAYPTLTGSGVTVGVLSDSFNCYAVYAANNVPASGPAGYASNGFLADAEKDMSTGDLPASVNVIAEPSASGASTCLDYGAPEFLPFTDEGRAMLQVVHDIAPGASLAFYTADNSEADFANGIGVLAKAGAKVEADDSHYFDEPFYQDGILAQAIDNVEAQGVAYFSSAGNDGQNAYENTAPSFATLSSSAPNAGEYLLNFDTSGATTTTTLPVTIPALVPGEFLGVVVEWDQPYVTGAPGSPGATSRIDVCVAGTSGGDEITDLDGNPISCTGPNAAGVDPVQIIIIGNPANATGNTAPASLNFMVGLADGTTAPGRIIVAVEDNGAGSMISPTFATNSATLQGHPGAAGAAAVGAAFYFDTPRCGTTPATVDAYSSEGGAPILFDVSGNRLAAPVFRPKPDFIGPDGGNDTFLGFTLASDGFPGGKLNTTIAGCQNDPNYPNFFGTSAATPHAASIAALMLQANSGVTPAQIYRALQTSALPMGGTIPNYTSGYGFIQADAALALLPAGPPTLSLSATTVTVGASTTLSWSSINTTSCAAAGSWSGAKAVSGSQTITPMAAGTLTYTLTCTNPVASAASSATLMVTAASSGGGGGGSLDGMTLLTLAALGLARQFRQLRRCRRYATS